LCEHVHFVVFFPTLAVGDPQPRRGTPSDVSIRIASKLCALGPADFSSRLEREGSWGRDSAPPPPADYLATPCASVYGYWRHRRQLSGALVCCVRRTALAAVAAITASASPRRRFLLRAGGNSNLALPTCQFAGVAPRPPATGRHASHLSCGRVTRARIIATGRPCGPYLRHGLHANKLLTNPSDPAQEPHRGQFAPMPAPTQPPYQPAGPADPARLLWDISPDGLRAALLSVARLRSVAPASTAPPAR